MNSTNDIMALSAASFESRAPPQLRPIDYFPRLANAPGVPYLMNPPNGTSTLKICFAFTAVIGTLLSGFTVAAILSDTNRLLQTDINPAYNSGFGDFWQCMQFLFSILIALGVYSSRHIWLAGSSILCLLTFACGLAHTGTHLFVLRTLIGVLLAIMMATAQLLASSYYGIERMNKDILLYSGLIVYIGSFCAYPFAIGLSLELTWRGSLFIMSIIDVVLFALSFMFLPTDWEWHLLLGPFRLVRKGPLEDWTTAPLVICCLGQLCYILG